MLHYTVCKQLHAKFCLLLTVGVVARLAVWSKWVGQTLCAYYPGAFGLISFQWMCLSLTKLVYIAEPCVGKSVCVAGVSVLLRVPEGSSSQAECAH